ncbi:3-deoxy-manno-octulosonate cytidylyltransferase [uncultured Roseburia sp.]|uniref:3-deoxy-manno-octulosonate cytidylyltransferase n=1 Tax=Brotonthovivens ammoniilytica TaxID=2981725 RepID=A0ABT2TF58_9FIRM|nr:3-deoxy-manno-octulosonate cytidylyltransferase [Brotonthovivens ammoniilytica]MCU6760819.1 3-deoxy-manno-octulosonate cytidylyltransferase [Brotonthovivens ammoniilytica]SCI10301.1 3-deoxy-manno-octulosonate cytidylyltransferase [uncultured Roseburia sp.]
MAHKYKIIWIENGKERELSADEKIENLNIITNEVTKDNIIKIHAPARFSKGTVIDLRGIATAIEINSSKFSYNFSIITCLNGKNMKIRFGKDISMWKDTYFFLNDDYSEIDIGDGCMFSKNVAIWASDGHAIIDKNTEKLLNKSIGKVKIGDRVWIGTHVTINKDVQIGNDCVIGEGSVVFNSISESNCIISGNPAHIVKRNVIWKRNRPHGWEYHNFSSKESKLINEIKERKIISVIPARYQSSRFPGKPLAKICGKPMIQWVYEQVKSVREISDVYVATDDQRIYDTVLGFGGKVIMTGDCTCGSERVYQACQYLEADIVLNIQGDEPLIKKEMILDLISAFNDPDVYMATLKKRIVQLNDINNSNIVKVITNSSDNAIYFSRSIVPYNRDQLDEISYYKHVGVYGYKKEFLAKFVKLPKTKLEICENLEQLRAIENDYKIRVIETEHDSIGVDLPEHINIVENVIEKERFKNE